MKRPSEVGTNLTVPNRPRRPRADGEMVWQPETCSFLTNQSSQATAHGIGLRGLGQLGPIQMLVAKRFTTQAS